MILSHWCECYALTADEHSQTTTGDCGLATTTEMKNLQSQRKGPHVKGVTCHLSIAFRLF